MKYINILVLTLLVVSLSLHGCKKAGTSFFKRTGGKFSAGTKVTKPIALGAAAIVAVGATIITLEVLEESFKNAPDDKTPISASFLNKSLTETIDLNFTLDGSTWNQAKIEPKGKYDVNSTSKGMIGVNAGDNFFKIDKSNLFFIDKIGGDFKLSD